MLNFSNSTANETRWLNYLLEQGFAYYPYLLLNFIGIVVGVLGNLTVIWSIIRDPKLRSNPTYMLMANLALSDLGISTLVHTFTNVGIIHSQGYFEERMGFCIFLGAWCLFMCATSLFNMGFLAINRYLNICHNRFYQVIFTRRNAFLFCALAWICGFLIDLPNLVGWGGHFFDPKAAQCNWNRLANHSYTMFMPITAIFIPCALIGFCYFRIFWFLRKKNYFSQQANMSRREARSIAVARSLFISFALFVVCWLPYGIVIITGFSDSHPFYLHIIAALLEHLNSSANPIFYMLFNPAFSFKKSRQTDITGSLSVTKK
nr:G protein-coupled receptor [Proales similis]